MEHYGVDELYPSYSIWEQYTTDAFSAAQRLDALRSSHPVIVPIKHAEEVEQVFDAISYCKGSVVVNMVNAIVGKENFRKGLQIYMKRHAYGNTETSDLWQAWSEASGVDIAAVMKTWTTRMGYPYVKTVDEKWTDTAVEFTLEQAWFLADGSEVSAEDAKDALWQIPLLFSTTVNGQCFMSSWTTVSLNFLPISRFASNTVLVAFMATWFFAASPINRSLSLNAT
jgi:aminopeptidase N